MTLHFSSLRSLLLFGLCACLSLQVGRSAPQNSEQTPTKTPAPIVHFTDVAAKVGLTASVVFGGEKTKKYIIETTGTGVAIFDYDNDGWPDIFIVNGTKLEGFPNGKAPTSHLYHNNHDGTFTDVTEKAGLTHTGWGQGVCVGDYDNDGFEDLYVTYYGKNILYHNNGNGTFTDVSEKAGVAGNGKMWGTGCAFVDYDRDGKLDLMVADYVDYDSATALAPGERPSCMWKGVPVMCGPRGLPWSKNILYRNLGNGTFEDVTKKANIDKTNGHYAFSVSTLDYDDDGWPDIYVACDSTASILYHNNHDGTFTDVAVISGAAFNDDVRDQASIGSALADYDGDERLDIFKTNFSDDTSTLYHNNRNGNHWIAFRTMGTSFSSGPSSGSGGTKSNRDSIGAKITVKAGARTFVDEVRSGSRYISNNDMRVHFGLGSAAKIDSVQVRWPSGLVERFENLPVDAIHTLKEGSGTPPDRQKPHP